jgi:sterol desaturase/sphingolipid hydroxylase (fatty acid hydroxylase superfamily)
MERIAAGLLNIVYRSYDLLFSVGSQISLTSLGCAFVIAAAFLTLRHIRRRGRMRPRVLLRALFPRRILLHRSTGADIGWLLFNCFVYGAIFGLAGLSYQFLTNSVVRGLASAFGPVTPSAWPEIAQRTTVTVILFFAYEFGYWTDHYLKHRIPALWEVHKVHHTAEVLTPLTTFRMHPLDTLVFGHVLAMTAALANGVAAYAFGDTTYQYALSGTNILLVLFIHAYVHLQHSHIWIAFRGLLGRVFVSPAHHQIHHSTNPMHFNKNLGSCLAIFDWMFGTLHIPAKSPERLTYGVEPAIPDAHTVSGEFLSPFGRFFAVLFGWMRRRPAAAPAPVAQASPR